MRVSNLFGNLTPLHVKLKLNLFHDLENIYFYTYVKLQHSEDATAKTREALQKIPYL